MGYFFKDGTRFTPEDEKFWGLDLDKMDEDGEGVVTTINGNKVYREEEPCDNPHNHEFTSRDCPACGKTFCFACCGSTNVDQGGKYNPDYMLCPACGHDIYE